MRSRMHWHIAIVMILFLLCLICVGCQSQIQNTNDVSEYRTIKEVPVNKWDLGSREPVPGLRMTCSIVEKHVTYVEYGTEKESNETSLMVMSDGRFPNLVS
jgi:hypothetical protein